jgi:predicted nucleotidyltransferase
MWRMFLGKMSRTENFDKKMVKKKPLIRISKRKIVDFCKRNHIRRLAFFGSVLREDFMPGSDIDILVEFDPVYVHGLFSLVRMEEELSSVFNGHKVDLRTPRDLSRYFRDDVLAMAEELYVED